MRKFISLLIVLYWLGMMTWLTLEKVVRESAQYSEVNYQSALKKVEQIQRTQMNIYDKNGKKIGRVRRAVIPQPDLSYRQVSRFELTKYPLSFYRPGTIELNLVVDIDKQYRLSDLNFTVWYNQAKYLTLQGYQGANGFNLYVDKKLFKTLPSADANNLFGTNISTLDKLPQLQEGKKWSINIISPFQFLSGKGTGEFETVRAEAGPLETIVINGKQCQAHKITIRASSQTTFAYVTPQGEVLEERSELYILRKTDFEYDNWTD